MLIEAKVSEDPSLEITKPTELLDQVASCLKHATFFRKARENFYNMKQSHCENVTTYFSRIMELYRQSEFPANSDFLVVDKLIHGCTNDQCKRKLMEKTSTATIQECLDILRKYESVNLIMKRMGQREEISQEIHAANLRHVRDDGKRLSTRNRYSANNANFSCQWCKLESHAK